MTADEDREAEETGARAVPGDQPDDPDDPGEGGRDAVRRRRRAAVFGEVLPESTSDDRADAWGERPASTDDWLRGQVPPHHG